MFSLRSDTKPSIKEKLKPKLEFRSWDNLNQTEKEKIRKYLEGDFFLLSGEKNDRKYELSQERFFFSIYWLNEKYKFKSYAKNFLKKNSDSNASYDFYNIYLFESENVFYELFSIYLYILYEQIEKSPYDFEVTYDSKSNKYLSLMRFREYLKRINDVFGQYGINVYFTPTGIIPRQEKKIIENIYDPVLDCLFEEKWISVNRDLKDSFEAYTKKDYSKSVTLSISVLQGFLQILINGKIGKGDLGNLINDAIKNKLIPDDEFSRNIYKNVESTLMKIRQVTGHSHPKQEYSDEKTAKFVLNLVMIFIHHCIENVGY